MNVHFFATAIYNAPEIPNAPNNFLVGNYVLENYNASESYSSGK